MNNWFELWCSASCLSDLQTSGIYFGTELFQLQKYQRVSFNSSFCEEPKSLRLDSPFLDQIDSDGEWSNTWTIETGWTWDVNSRSITIKRSYSCFGWWTRFWFYCKYLSQLMYYNTVWLRIPETENEQNSLHAYIIYLLLKFKINNKKVQI